MKKYKFLILQVTLLLMVVPMVSFSAFDEGVYTYLFRLYYDNGQLFADRDFEFKYDLIAEPFVQPELSTSTPYRGEVFSVSDASLGRFQFDPTVAKGKISVKGPYFSNAAKVNFYNNTGQLLLTLSVADSSVCNEDKICNSDTGEDYNNCSADCKAPEVPSAGGGIPRGILYGIAGVIAAVVVWVIWIIIKRRKSGGIMPPPAMPGSGGQLDSMPAILPKVMPPVPPPSPVPPIVPPSAQ